VRRSPGSGKFGEDERGLGREGAPSERGLLPFPRSYSFILTGNSMNNSWISSVEAG